MKHKYLFITVICLAFCSLILARPQIRSFEGKPRREVAMTIDDLPHSASISPVAEINRKLIESLARHKIPAVGFVNEGKLYAGGETNARIAILRMWLDAGHELGNHTFSHIGIDRNSLAEYQEDVIRGEKLTKMLLEERGMKLRYFRHTQLRTGPTLEYQKGLDRFLAARGYTVAPVTIDNQEWVFAEAYARAKERGDQVNRERVAREYIKYMDDVFAFFEKLSTDFLGYEVKQTLLLHCNELNADHLDALVDMIRRRGYSFITLEEALNDKAYRLPAAQSKMGLSWLHRWMIAKGLKMRSEPRDPQWLSELLESYSRK
jgi:peptidoglycan-N-acetylglucosamine deacetylase